MKTILDFQKAKNSKTPITMVTAYDYTSACLIDKTEIDCVLVGDSGSMVMLGHQTPIPATLDMMRYFTEAVARGTQKWIIADLPFLSYRINKSETMKAAQTLMQAGANSLKLEGAEGNLEIIAYLKASGVPVMGHLGLTPQSYHQIGGFRVQGKSEAAQDKILQDALALEEAGVYALVLECIPPALAKTLALHCKIPTIGIGAGPHVDGQVLVFHDLLGLNPDFQTRFNKRYLEGGKAIIQALSTYHEEVRNHDFPTTEHSYEDI